ncbi:MAG: transaminase [Candidatus Pacebacteria bacterium]|nr:transaminase [Candidatus Paceibacterota bacterium]
MYNDKKIAAIQARVNQEFLKLTPKSREQHEKSRGYWLRGVPMHWMVDWQCAYPLYIDRAQGVTMTDLDGNHYADFCLGDTGSMFGHSTPEIVEALTTQASRGITTMKPSRDAEAVGKLLTDIFGMAVWQVTATASDANRSIIRWCRAVTGRQKLLVFNQCYHGSVDETLVVHRPGGALGEADYDPILSMHGQEANGVALVEFNDLPSLRKILETGTVACILAEPIMTNVGMVLPDDGYWAEVRRLCTETGTLLIIDETHTISSGPGGHFRELGLKSDALVLGKPVAGGVPAGVYGVTAELAGRISDYFNRIGTTGRSGTSTTLSGSPFQLALMRKVLATSFTAATYAPMIAKAKGLEAGIKAIIAEFKAPWVVIRVGARVEFMCSPTPPHNGSEALKVIAQPIDTLIHAFLINHGVVITPFHNMMLISPVTTDTDVEKFLKAFRAVTKELME